MCTAGGYASDRTFRLRNSTNNHFKIEFSWNERQFVLPGHVANKIGIGATRNLVVRGVHSKITEERIRDDLEHIHNLVIINIAFENGDAYISLNSIHNALFARTCMMSRVTYKGQRIEWYPDECSQPLPKTHHVPKKDTLVPPPTKRSNPLANRFQMLNMDNEGTEDGSEETEDLPTVISDLPNLNINHRTPWSPRTVVA